MNKYFKRKEFACKCGCGSATVDAQLLEIITDVREHFGKPTSITSGHRCYSHNSKVGGAKNSVHLTGRAADIKVSGVSPSEVHSYLIKKYPDTLGIGKYANFTHVDTRDGKSRWNG
ncbi:M15A domain-containing protein [Pectobacterium phage POP72]|uniref:Peptidase M15A domain-containing protein n=2 Tax=Axomammavirus PP1 TaxID=2733578 RepID=I7FWL0_9CAUD|nr:endolysin [Pectobacterium phage PP1]AFP33709.1 peptidase M15A domain-containing protein [Pectobacterium phage PP1]ARB10968.1 M15A domain-containing protein [Pectobacterium phage POP72]